MMETTKAERLEALRRRAGAPDEANVLVMLGFLRSLCRDVGTLVGALDNLVSRLELIGENEQYKAVWVLHAAHGGKYTGPTYTAELAAARAVLEA